MRTRPKDRDAVERLVGQQQVPLLLLFLLGGDCAVRLIILYGHRGKRIPPFATVEYGSWC